MFMVMSKVKKKKKKKKKFLAYCMERKLHDFHQCQLNSYKTKTTCDVTQLVILKKFYFSFSHCTWADPSNVAMSSSDTHIHCPI